MNRALVSFSGGKDSHLAFHLAKQNGFQMVAVGAMMVKDRLVSCSNAVHLSILEAQAKALGVSLYSKQTCWKDYEKDFTSLLKEVIEKKNIDCCVFGDIDLIEHRQWGERVCGAVGLKAVYPLWEQQREDLMSDLITKGFKMRISVIDLRKLSQEYLGKNIDSEMLVKFRSLGIDLSGELGEYHTLVCDSPDYSKKIEIEAKGIVKVDDNHAVIELVLA